MIGEDIKTTISAQLGTLPILLGVFGKVGLWSVIVNALVLWTIPIVMTLGSLAVLTGIFLCFWKDFSFYELTVFVILSVHRFIIWESPWYDYNGFVSVAVGSMVLFAYSCNHSLA